MRISGQEKWIAFVFTLLLLCSCVQQMGKEGRIQSMSQPPDGTVAQKDMLPLNAPRNTLPFMKKGREQYQIYCMPCHGVRGDGNGVIVQRGFLAPPTYHQERLRKSPDSHYFEVMTQGYGAMLSYADRISVPERWSIIAYIRALQLSQNANYADLPSEDQKRLPKL